MGLSSRVSGGNLRIPEGMIPFLWKHEVRPTELGLIGIPFAIDDERYTSSPFG